MQYTPQHKQLILTHYQAGVRGAGFDAVARRFAVRGGGAVIKRWHDRWDGTPQSLQHKAGAGRPRTLSAQQVSRHVRAPLLAANRAHLAVHYSKLLPSVRAATGTELTLRTLQRYGKEELGAKQRKGKKRTADELSADLCEQIAQVRRKLQRISKDRVVFLDETLKREGAVDNYSIFLPGEPPYIETSVTSRYAARYDMIAACTGKEVLLPSIYAPSERGAGITTAVLVRFIDNLLAQQLRALDRYPLLLLLDRASIHNEDKIMEALRDRGCGEVTAIIKLPPASAKRLSPLDNSLFNLWRQRVLASGPLTRRNIKQRMSDAWNSITAAELHAQYSNCGLMDGQDVYFDCPDPAAHRHRS